MSFFYPNVLINLFVFLEFWVLRVTNLNGLPHSLLSYGHLIPGERACTGRTCLIKKFFQGPSKGRYIPWAVPEDSGLAEWSLERVVCQWLRTK